MFDFAIPDESDLSTFYPAAITNAFYWAKFILRDRLSRLGFDRNVLNFEDDDPFGFYVDKNTDFANAELVQTPPDGEPAVAALFPSLQRRPSSSGRGAGGDRRTDALGRGGLRAPTRLPVA